MVQLPSPAQEFTTKHATVTSLADSVSICKLHDILFQVTLPKTKTAKLALIVVDALHTACDLVTAACASLKEGIEGPMLKEISNQLDTIMAYLIIPGKSPSIQKYSYASALTTGLQPPTSDASPPSPPLPPHPCLRTRPTS